MTLLERLLAYATCCRLTSWLETRRQHGTALPSPRSSVMLDHKSVLIP